MAHFVLVHGAWGGGWVWDDVVPRLQADGHRVTVMARLPSCGSDPALLGDLRADAERVREVVREAGEPVVLVGHSYGGMVVTELADEPAVTHTVYLAAFRPRRGQSLLDITGNGLPPWVASQHDGALEATKDVDTLRAHFAPAMPQQLAEQLAERLELQSVASFATPSTAPDPGHPVTYLVCEEDLAVPVEAQEAMAVGADRVVRLAAPHLAQSTIPDRLTAELAAVAAR